MKTQESRLLVVDDEKIVCDSCTRILSNQGFSVEAITDPLKGLKLATENKYAAILLDIKMPAIDGLEFLEELKKRNINVPVIIITGYSSIQNAAAAMRLGAADFIPKPFTPDELFKAVERLMGTEGAVEKKETTELTDVALQQLPTLPKETEPQIIEYSKGYHFLDDCWFQKTSHDFVRVGAFLSSLESRSITSAQLPKIGDKVFRGLPLASFNIGGKLPHVIPSPVTGEVVTVHESLLSADPETWEMPCDKAWIAHIRPENLEEDLQVCTMRSAILMNANESKRQAQVELLTNLGCSVQVADSLEAVAESARKEKVNLFIIDTTSFRKEGPEIVREINSMLPDLKVVAIAAPDSKWETDYRTNKILYYAIEPLVEMEMVDILNSVFSRTMKSAPEIAPSRNLPNWISKISITNRHSKKVNLLVAGEILLRHKGIGLQLHDLFLNNSYPITVTLGAKNYDVIDIIKETDDCDSLLILESKNIGKIPGSVLMSHGCELMKGISSNTDKIKTLTIQADNAQNASFIFDARTSKALAEFILKEMTSH